MQFLTTLRSHYAGVISHIFIIDAPTCFQCLWTVFKPFVAKETREKMHFVKSKHGCLAEHYEKDQAACWMMPGGTKNRDLDVDEYLYQTPFDRAFEDNDETPKM
jgi:hypothetical protein